MRASRIVLIAFLSGFATAANADWPMPRHDPQRTGRASGVAEITSPGAYWRYFLGGGITWVQAMPIERDGAANVVFIAGGRLHAATAAGQSLWRSENFPLTELVAATDLDGDGALDIVARSTARVYIFDGATGALQWAEDPADMGTIGGVRVADLDGDGLDDIVVQECMCCQLRSGNPGFAYSFASGFDNPTRLWSLPHAYCGGGLYNLAIADLDGDGDVDVTTSNGSDIQIIDAASAEPVAASGDLGTWIALSVCTPVQADDDPAFELVCALGTALAPGAGHRLFLLDYEDEPRRLALRWSTDVGDRDGALGLGTGVIQDLDGDGTLEAVATGVTAEGEYRTVVLDLATGVELAAITGELSIGAVEFRPGAHVFLTQAASAIHAWRFERDGTPALRFVWQLKDRRPLLRRDWQASKRLPAALTRRLIAFDVNGNGSLDLFTVNLRAPNEIAVHDLSVTMQPEIATWSGSADADVLAAWLSADGTVLVSAADGRLTTLGPDASPTGAIRAGGYYDSGGWLHLPWAPVSSRLDTVLGDEVLVTDSRRALLALDARGATNVGPPRKLWEMQRSSAPAIVPGLGTGGSPGVACRTIDTETVPATEMVTVIDAAGTIRWQRPVGQLVFNDVLHGNFDGDAIPDLVVQWGLPSDAALRTTAFAGSDGRELWTTVTDISNNRNPSGAAVVDWNGDGIDDVVFHHFGTRVLSGSDGAEIAVGGSSQIAYFMPTIVDVTGDGVPEISLHGSIAPSRTLSSDLQSSLWVSGDDERPYPYAAVSTCEAGPVLVGASLARPSELRVTLQSGPSTGATQTRHLAGGEVYIDEDAATEAGAIGGQLTSVTVHTGLTGAGEAAAVVGSSDGWLYAVDPCSLALRWSLRFGVPVGAVAFGDPDGDGLDEIIVLTADGYLRGVRHAPIAAPARVWEIDPRSGTLNDVDEIVTRDELTAAWEPVAGAAGYEVAVALEEGGIVSTPTWHAVDATGTTATIRGLPLTDGARYVVAVRAISAFGPSPDELSDGVLVRLDDSSPMPDAGFDDPPSGPAGGCCSATGGGAGPGILALGVILLGAGAGQRRRRAPR